MLSRYYACMRSTARGNQMAPVRPEDFDYAFQPSRLKTLRENLKLTQADMATLLDIPVNTLSRWERGSNSPDANALAAIYSIAQERGTTPEFFVKRPNPMDARKTRINLVVSWDFQNIPLRNDQIGNEWGYLEQYIEALFSNIQNHNLYAYGRDWQAHSKLREAGFEVKSYSYDVDRQIIREGEQLFKISNPGQNILSHYQDVPFARQIVVSSGLFQSQPQTLDPNQSVYILISNDGDYTDFLKQLQQAGVEAFVWGTDYCSARLRDAVGEDHFIHWRRPYVTVKCIEVARELNGRSISKGEFGNMCKKALEETGDEIFPEDAGFSPKRPYASALKYMELNGLVRVRDLNSANQVSIVVRND